MAAGKLLSLAEGAQNVVVKPWSTEWSANNPTSCEDRHWVAQ